MVLDPQDRQLDHRLGSQDDKGLSPADKKQLKSSVVKEWIGLLARAGVWALLIYQFVFQVSVVRGESMKPNFESNDRLLIDKVAYRFSEPDSGDVVVFEAVVPSAVSSETGETTSRRIHRDYIKRIIAGPFDKVVIKHGNVFVNGQQLDEEWEPNSFSRIKDYPDEFIVPPNRYFVLGDNRGNSEDSRGNKIGYVSIRQIKGKVRCRFWPFERIKWF